MRTHPAERTGPHAATRLSAPLAALAGLLLLTGCTVGPDAERPVTVADDAAGYVHATEAQEAARLADVDVDPWWVGFGDPATEELVRAALAENPDLRAAAARVLETRARLGVARSTLWPSVDAALGVQRQRTSFVLPEGRTDIYSTTYSTDLSAAYQVDLFGRLRRTREAAWADLLAQEAARESVVHTVIAETVRGRIRLATLDESLRIAVEIRDSWERTLRSVDRRYRSGLVPALDLRLARENAAAARARVVDLESQLAQARLALDVLVGVRPGVGPRPATTLDPLPDLEPVPLGLPAELLDRRPDLRQAELELAAATARIGVAIADLFPQLSLTGSTGVRSDTLSDVLTTDGLVYNLIANLAGPVFDGGRRRAEVDAAEARAEAAAALYSKAVLQALREVEDALVRDDSLRRQIELLEERLDEARAADRIARDRYLRGVETLLRVLETERRLRSAEEALTAARSAAWNARTDLYLALGGDWLENPQTSDPAPVEAS